jgi:hypothetical protein
MKLNAIRAQRRISGSEIGSEVEILRCAQDDGLRSYDEYEKRCGVPGEGTSSRFGGAGSQRQMQFEV